MMNHKLKIKRHLKEMKDIGLPKSLVAPPYYRFLWMLGSEKPPPLFQSPKERLATIKLGLFLTWTSLWIALSIYFFQGFIIAPPLLIFMAVMITGGWGFASSTGRAIIKGQEKMMKDINLNLVDWKDYGLANNSYNRTQ